MKLLFNEKKSDNKADLMKEVVFQTERNLQGWLSASGMTESDLKTKLKGKKEYSFSVQEKEDGQLCVHIFADGEVVGTEIVYSPEQNGVYTPGDWALDVSFLLLFVGNNFTDNEQEGTAYYNAINAFISDKKTGLERYMK